MIEVLFDSTRLFMRASGAPPTGIDRVNEAYAKWLLLNDHVRLTPVCTWGGRVAPVSLEVFKTILRSKATRMSAPSELWPRLVAALQSPESAHEVLRAKGSENAVTAAFRARASTVTRYVKARLRAASHWRPPTYGKGAIYLNVSHYGLEQPGLLGGLEAAGVRPMVMIHDLIPIEHPEYCSPSASGWHRRRIEAVLGHARLVIANSETTASELRSYARQRQAPVPSLCVAPLGLEPHFTAPCAEPLAAPPYFVCLGTIEPRKNLTFLLTVWRRLADRLGDATPMLVLAGQRGWENESVIDHLDRSPPIRRFVHEISGLADRELARLIAGARALLSPSFTEGFNLPVAEAIALGTPVIASDIPVHRELARGAALIDPIDGPAWLAALEAATRERPRAAPLPATTWADHFDIVGRIMELAEPDAG